METIRGKITVDVVDDGSKSQGEVAYIRCDESKEQYVIYRAGMLPQNDAFLCSLAGTTVVLHGDTEENGYFCVESITSESGEAITIPKKILPGLNRNIFIDNSKPESECIKKMKRIPRKLKKILKKQKK
ncbi:MAG: hypothetical protein J6Q48_06830 [Bacteroidaceae bacterium]|jgi:hypothetical protein|nr:hypothetical protein [Bacteroidaceae bacterium]